MFAIVNRHCSVAFFLAFVASIITLQSVSGQPVIRPTHEPDPAGPNFEPAAVAFFDLFAQKYTFIAILVEQPSGSPRPTASDMALPVAPSGATTSPGTTVVTATPPSTWTPGQTRERYLVTVDRGNITQLKRADNFTLVTDDDHHASMYIRSIEEYFRMIRAKSAEAFGGPGGEKYDIRNNYGVPYGIEFLAGAANTTAGDAHDDYVFLSNLTRLELYADKKAAEERNERMQQQWTLFKHTEYHFTYQKAEAGIEFPAVIVNVKKGVVVSVLKNDTHTPVSTDPDAFLTLSDWFGKAGTAIILAVPGTLQLTYDPEYSYPTRIGYFGQTYSVNGKADPSTMALEMVHEISNWGQKLVPPEEDGVNLFFIIFIVIIFFICIITVIVCLCWMYKKKQEKKAEELSRARASASPIPGAGGRAPRPGDDGIHNEMHQI